MRLLSQFNKGVFVVVVIIILSSFFLHSLQVPHDHFKVVELHEIHKVGHHHDHHSERHRSADHTFGLPDFLHSSDKKDIFTILVSLASLALISIIIWPKIQLVLLEMERFIFKRTTKKILVVFYLKALLAIGILNPKVH